MRRARKSRNNAHTGIGSLVGRAVATKGLMALLAAVGLAAGCGPTPPEVATVDSGTTYTMANAGLHASRDPHAALGPDKLLQVALQHRAEGRVPEALAVLTQAIAQYPNTAALFSVRGALLLEEKKYAAALDDLEAAVKIDPKDPVTLTNRAQAYRAFNRTQESLADLDRAVELEPDMVAARFNRGAIQYTRGKYQAALADFDQCIRADPGTPAPYFNRAVTHDALGNRRQAIADLQQFVQLSDNAAWKQTATDLLKKWETESALPAVKPKTEG